MRSVVYGTPPAELAEVPEGAVQVCPLVPGSARLEDVPARSLDSAVVLAPGGTLERRFALALAARALKVGGTLVALAPKDRGGARLAKDLTGFGLRVAEEARRHHRVCTAHRAGISLDLAAALAEGGPRHVDNLALCTQPGVFSWDRLDPGTALLLASLPPLAGAGADLGCGLGVLARAVLASPAVTALDLVEIDGRALDMARRNVVDRRAAFHWADVRGVDAAARLDFVVMNPPFHAGHGEDRELGIAFIRRAADLLRPGGVLWLTANAHLPYERPLADAFRAVTQRAAAHGYKVFEARR